MLSTASLRRMSAVVGTAAAVMAALAATAGAAAAATTANQFTLCATGNYAAFAVFPNRGNFSTFVVNPGNCTTVHLSGMTNDSVAVKGEFNGTGPNGGTSGSSTGSRTIGSFSFNDSVGGGADAAGTTGAPELLRW